MLRYFLSVVIDGLRYRPLQLCCDSADDIYGLCGCLWRLIVYRSYPAVDLIDNVVCYFDLWKSTYFCRFVNLYPIFSNAFSTIPLFSMHALTVIVMVNYLPTLSCPNSWLVFLTLQSGMRHVVLVNGTNLFCLSLISVATCSFVL